MTGVKSNVVKLEMLGICLILTLLNALNLSAQENKGLVEGEVSYTTGQNIYTKFESTQGIERGDTLFVRNENTFLPALIVIHKSSISCLCNYISEIRLTVNDKVWAKIQPSQIEEDNIVEEPGKIEQDINEQILKKAVSAPAKETFKQQIDGRLSVSSYSMLYNLSEKNSHRFRYTLNFNANNIAGSKLSFESYISFSHQLNEWNVVKEDLFNALKIYSLDLGYRVNKNLQFWFGRKINPNIANVGAIDGLQVQAGFGSFYAGAAIGSRPDFSNYNFNPSLFETGGYIGHTAKNNNGSSQSSIAFFEQQNKGKTDRRFVYLQHTNTLIKNISLFASTEIDLHKLENGQPKSGFSLTGLYLSIRYRLSSKASVFGSYDARRNVIYYETFKSYSEMIVQNASRQGLRFQVNYRPFNMFNVGIDAGTRFQQNDNRRNNTLNSFITYSKLPVIDASLTISGNILQTSYLNGEIYSARLTRDFFKGKVNTLFNYQFVNFRYVNSETKLLQNIGELSLAWQCNKKLYLSVNLETTLQDADSYNRIYFNIRQKF